MAFVWKASSGVGEPLPAKGTVGSHRKAGNLEKRSEKILTLLCENPDRPARELATALNLSPRAVEKQIARLRADGRAP